MKSRPTLSDMVQVTDGSLRGKEGLVTDDEIKQGLHHYHILIEGQAHWVPEAWLQVLVPQPRPLA